MKRPAKENRLRKPARKPAAGATLAKRIRRLKITPR